MTRSPLHCLVAALGIASGFSIKKPMGAPSGTRVTHVTSTMSIPVNVDGTLLTLVISPEDEPQAKAAEFLQSAGYGEDETLMQDLLNAIARRVKRYD